MYDFSPILSRIKKVKSSLGFTNEDLSQKSGVAIGTINKILSGDTKEPKLPALMAIASALEVSVDYLIYGTQANQPQDANTLKLVTFYDGLNEDGKEELLKYAEYLSSRTEYKKFNEPEVVQKEA